MALRSSTDRVALLKMETTYGTGVVTAAADAILLMNAQVQPMADKLERNIDLPYFGGDPFVLVGKRITLSGETDLLGPSSAGVGTLAAPLGKLYRTCGHAETLVGPTPGPASVKYNPISKNFESATVDFYWAGIKFRMTGVRGYFDMDFSIKNFAKATITLTGLLTIPADGEPPGPIDWTPFQTPAAIETETWLVTVGGINVCAQQLTLAQNATINVIECSESREVTCTDRKPTGTLKVYKDSTLATWNPWAIANAQNQITLVNTLTKGAGLNVAVPMNVQLEYPKPVDMDGVAGFEIPFTCIPISGGDEYVITFT